VFCRSQGRPPEPPFFRCARLGRCAWLLCRANKSRVCTCQAVILRNGKSKACVGPAMAREIGQSTVAYDTPNVWMSREGAIYHGLLSPLLLGARAHIYIGQFAYFQAAERRAAPSVWHLGVSPSILFVLVLAKCKV
jgi:hypothetical protein